VAAVLYRPHDLLWLRVVDRFEPVPGWPEWLDCAWLVHAPLVVRREAVAGSRVPVGARGGQRNQRCQGYVQRAAVARHITPEMLATICSDGGRRVRSRAHAADASCHRVTVRTSAHPTANPALAHSPFAPLRALAALAPRLRSLGLAWGPTGGTGFFLASGLPVLREDSDLDLLVRSPTPLPGATVEALLAMQAAAGCRVDIQVDTGVGGFALSEYAQGRGRVLLKTGTGPLLLADPWRVPEAA
jgi:phosphoribosyl-dephospho-CoA transferase